MTQDKIVSWAEAAERVRISRQTGHQIVFTNGCFDILHAGHIQYLEQARALGDILVVGLNSDASVRLLKGPSRPVVGETDRGIVLAALACVDLVVIFSQETPLELITLIQPDVLVKGGDWRPEDIVGSEVVLSRGGSVLSLPFKQGHSSSALIARLESFPN